MEERLIKKCVSNLSTLPNVFQGPTMQQARFHHGCIVTELDEEVVVLVAGGLGPDHHGDGVESLSLTGKKRLTISLKKQ